MRLNSKAFAGTPVQTRSGQTLGKVASVNFDSESGRLAGICVKTRGLVPGLLDQELFVAWDQIIEITATAVIVQEGTIPVGARALASAGSVDA